MDEMDGLGTDADVVFLLTTNRPQALEAALASRPGRVDQAIFFPLPDLECRQRLFQQFGQGLEVGSIDMGPLLARTAGSSPAFLKELFRRAALLAIERGAKGTPLPLLLEDFEEALHELLQSGGELTRSFLGFPVRAEE
jgi:ATP-dependent 26S proteasome regulatory subunit